MADREQCRAAAERIDKLQLAESKAYRKFEQYLRSGNIDAGGARWAYDDLLRLRASTDRRLTEIAELADWEDPDQQQELKL